MKNRVKSRVKNRHELRLIILFFIAADAVVSRLGSFQLFREFLSDYLQSFVFLSKPYSSPFHALSMLYQLFIAHRVVSCSAGDNIPDFLYYLYDPYLLSIRTFERRIM